MENGEEEEEKPFPFKYLFDPNWNPSFLIEFRSGQAKNRTFPLFSGMGVCPGQTVFCRCRLEPFPTITVEVEKKVFVPSNKSKASLYNRTADWTVRTY